MCIRCSTKAIFLVWSSKHPSRSSRKLTLFQKARQLRQSACGASSCPEQALTPCMAAPCSGMGAHGRWRIRPGRRRRGCRSHPPLRLAAPPVRPPPAHGLLTPVPVARSRTPPLPASTSGFTAPAARVEFWCMGGRSIEPRPSRLPGHPCWPHARVCGTCYASAVCQIGMHVTFRNPPGKAMQVAC